MKVKCNIDIKVKKTRYNFYKLKKKDNYKGILTFSKKKTKYFIKYKTPEDEARKFKWNGTFLYDIPISKMVNRISTICRVSLYYCTLGFYFILHPYNSFDYCIEILKCLFGLPVRPMHLCMYKGKKYFMFLTDPDYEMVYHISRKKYINISKENRRMGVFHWMIGVEGRFWRYLKNDREIFYSVGPYKINHKKELNKNELNKYFSRAIVKKDLNSFFNDKDKKYKVNEFLSANGMRWLYTELCRKSSYFS